MADINKRVSQANIEESFPWFSSNDFLILLTDMNERLTNCNKEGKYLTHKIFWREADREGGRT